MEIKDKIKNIMSSCEELLAEMNSNSNNTSESGLKINFDALHNTATKFKYSNGVISEIDDGSKSSYIKLLVFLFRKLEEKQLEIALLHIEKINIAMEINLDLENELINSYTYDEKTLVKLLNDISNLSEKASQMFVMDILVIISSAGITDQEILKEVASIFSKLGLEKVKIKELFNLCTYFIANDYEKYLMLVSGNYSINLAALYPYYKNKFKGLLSNNNSLTWIKGEFSTESLYKLCQKKVKKEMFGDEYYSYSKSGKSMVIRDTTINLTHNIEFNFNTLIFKNCYITINTSSRDNFFSNCGTVVFEDCELNVNNSYYIAIRFENCEKVILRSTNFIGTGERRCFSVKNCKKIIIENCSFNNFAAKQKSEYSYPARQGCFEISDSEEVIINQCRFKDCCTWHYEKGEANNAVGAFFNTYKVKISNCEFNNCKNNSWRYARVWNEVGYMFMLPKNIKPIMENNSFINCVEPYSPYNY